MSRFIFKSAKAVAFALLLGPLLSSASSQAQPLPPANPSTQAIEASAKREESRSDERIARMHDRLRIAPAQEELWGKVAQVMRDNRASFHASLGDKRRDADTTSAVDDLKSFQIIADEHSNGLRKLIPAFEALYAIRTPEQQKRADRVYSRRERDARR